MKAVNSKKLLLALIFSGGVFLSTQRVALAAPWWQFWNQNQNNNTSVNPPQGVASADPNFSRDQNSLNNDQQVMRGLYQKLQQDQRAGVDTTADLQAIANEKQSFADDRSRFQSDLAPAQANLAQDQNSLRNDQQVTRGLYQKLQQDQRAGVDTTADLQAIANEKQSTADDKARYAADGGTQPVNGRNRQWQQKGVVPGYNNGPNAPYHRDYNNPNWQANGNGAPGYNPADPHAPYHRRDYNNPNWQANGTPGNPDPSASPWHHHDGNDSNNNWQGNGNSQYGGGHHHHRGNYSNQ